MSVSHGLIVIPQLATAIKEENILKIESRFKITTKYEPRFPSSSMMPFEVTRATKLTAEAVLVYHDPISIFDSHFAKGAAVINASDSFEEENEEEGEGNDVEDESMMNDHDDGDEEPFGGPVIAILDTMVQGINAARVPLESTDMYANLNDKKRKNLNIRIKKISEHLRRDEHMRALAEQSSKDAENVENDLALEEREETTITAEEMSEYHRRRADVAKTFAEADEVSEWINMATLKDMLGAKPDLIGQISAFVFAQIEAINAANSSKKMGANPTTSGVTLQAAKAA